MSRVNSQPAIGRQLTQVDALLKSGHGTKKEVCPLASLH